LADLGSRNGTEVAGLRVREVYLKPGVEICVGDTALRFEQSGSSFEVPASAQAEFEGVIGRSVRMREVFALLEKVAKSDLNILIRGETGTGKERIARAIHRRSARRDQPFVVLDCSAIPKNLMESVVFGHERGSFTGAHERRLGVFEQGHGGTVFLDEIGELPSELQPKLLRLLEERTVTRIGSAKPVEVNVHVLAATHRDLRLMVNEGSFREDLYYRLAVFEVELPPLREREGDLPILVQHFLRQIQERRGERVRIGVEAMQELHRRAWSGNVRELRNAIERAAVLCEGGMIRSDDLLVRGGRSVRATAPTPASAAQASGERLTEAPFKEAKQRTIDRFERDYLRQLLEENQGNISQSAREAGLSRVHLRELLKRHELV
jgi:transcriptional regulator with GAF, ATPase, and Fis domain